MKHQQLRHILWGDVLQGDGVNVPTTSIVQWNNYLVAIWPDMVIGMESATAITVPTELRPQ